MYSSFLCTYSVYESNTEADNTYWEHEKKVVGAEGYQEAGDPFQGQANPCQGPGPLRELLGNLHCHHHSQHVGEKSREPDQTLWVRKIYDHGVLVSSQSRLYLILVLLL